MNCKYKKKFQDYSKYNTDNSYYIPIPYRKNEIGINNNEYDENIYPNTDRYWPLERFKSVNRIQKNLNNSFLIENDIYLNKQNSSNNILNYDDKQNSQYYNKYLTKNNFYENNSNNFSNLVNNNIFDSSNNHMQSYSKNRYNKKSFSRSSSGFQNEDFEPNIQKKYKDSLISNRSEIYIDLNKTKSFNQSSYNNKFNHSLNYNSNYHKNYNYYSSMNLLKNKYSQNQKIELDNPKIINNKLYEYTQNNNNEIKSMYLESKKKYRELLNNYTNTTNNKNENIPTKYKNNITKSNIESYQNKKSYNNNSNIDNLNDYSIDYSSKASIDNSLRNVNTYGNQIYKKVKLNKTNNQRIKNDNINLMRRDYSTGAYHPNNNSISPDKNLNNCSNFSSYINNYLNLKVKNKKYEKVNYSNNSNNTNKIKDISKSCNSFTTGTTNTFEDNIIYHKKNLKIIESVEELHINYVIMLQNTKNLIKYQENVNITLYPKNNNYSFKESTVTYIHEEEL